MPRSPGFVAIVDKAKESVKEVTLDELKAFQSGINPPRIIDVREESEWEAGHLPNATHLSKGVIERDIETTILDKEQPMVLYCGGGSRSALAAKNVLAMGYTNVMSLIGGYRGWLKDQAS